MENQLFQNHIGLWPPSPKEKGGNTGSKESLSAEGVLPCESIAAVPSFQHAWELQDAATTEDKGELRVYSSKDAALRDSRRARIARQVAATKEILHLSNVAKFLGEQYQFEEDDGFAPRNMLCVPIFNGQSDLIGVAQLVNKHQGQAFTEGEISLFEAFATFCGIGIHNTKMYEGACRLMAKQKVALDCLSYHASATDDDTDVLMKSEIAKASDFNLYRYV